MMVLVVSYGFKRGSYVSVWSVGRMSRHKVPLIKPASRQKQISQTRKEGHADIHSMAMVREQDEYKYLSSEIDGRLQHICLMARYVISRQQSSTYNTFCNMFCKSATRKLICRVSFSRQKLHGSYATNQCFAQTGWYRWGDFRSY
jgi:hypothetical protein